MLKSYYDILEIKSDASKAEIKKQFKKFAKMYHPDVNSSLEAEQKFKEINKAAEVLLNDEKRKNYDFLRSFNNKTDTNSSRYTYNDIFKKEKKPQKQTHKPIQGEDISINVEIDYTEALLGTQRTVNVSHSTICPKCLGYKFANGQKCSFCDGSGEKTENRKITVKIPKNLKNNTKLRIKGEGKKGKFGGEDGNLYVIVKIEKQEDLKIKDGIVYYDAPISPYVAVLGGNINIPTLWGEAMIKIPPLTKANQSFKLIDVGILDEKTNKKGEQIVKILIQIPSEISPQEHILYEKLKELNLNKTNGKAIYN